MGLFIAFGFDRPLKENLFSFVIAKFHNTHTHTHRERERERKKERKKVLHAVHCSREEKVRKCTSGSRVKRTGTKLVRNVAARTQNANESLYGASNAELRTESVNSCLM